MQVYVQGQSVRLDKQHYLGQGGEGSVYARGDTAYKIYSDPRKMIPVGKIQELSVIKDKRIVKPERVITNKGGSPIGYTMHCVRDGFALCQLFPRAFKERNQIDSKTITHLVRELQEGVTHVHQSNILIVDLNEMNFLVGKGFSALYFIDADSYQTHNFPATALMESIRDRHMKGSHAFTTLTDWFAFGIVSFQMFCGIHPFKGKHPTLKGFDERMRANVSVFNSSVSVPRAAYPVTVIPTAYRDWYRAVFEDGKRVPPPEQLGTVTVFVPDLRRITGTNLLEITEVGSYGGKQDTIRRVWCFGQQSVVASADSVWLNDHAIPGGTSATTAVAFSPRRNKAVGITKVNEVTSLYNLTDRVAIPFQLQPTDFMEYDGRVYLKVLGNVHELILTDAGTQVVASTKLAAAVLENATQLFPGVLIQNMLGSIQVSMFPKSGTTVQIEMQELSGYRVMDARYDRGVLMVIGERKGRYDRLVFRFDSLHQSYDRRRVKDITPAGLNFITLDSGVVVCLNEEDKLEVFRREKDQPKINYVEDPTLGGDMALVRLNGQLAFSQGNGLYRMQLKKKA